MTLDEAVDWLDADVPCLVFAGAGVSVSAPAGAPGVAVPLGATLDLLTSLSGPLPRDATAAMADVSKRLLPELVYGSVAAVAGTADHLRLWESYAWTATPTGPGPHPNAGHSLLAWLGHRHHLPVVTTNFDRLLEEAVARQGLRPVVGLPDRRNRFAAPVAGTGAVAIWKLHGTAVRVDTIRSQAADLARGSHRALARSLPRRPQRLLVVGYSGRDFDVFPWLAGLAGGARTLWVDVAFPPDHPARTVRSCTRLAADVEELARRFWRTATADPERRRWRLAVEAALARPAGEADLTRRRYAERVETATVAHLGPVLRADRARATVCLASALSTAADFRTTLTVLESAALGPAESVRSRLLRFFALESMDRHRDAERCAAVALRQAWSARDVFGLGRAEMAVAYARIRRFIGTIREPDLPRPRLRRDLPPRAAARLFADVALLAPVFAVAVLVVRRRTEGRRHYDALEFAGDYVEHAIRTGALIAAAGERLPAWLARWPLRVMWRTVGAAASAVGYLRGVVNSRKYLTRLAGRDAPVRDAVVAASLAGDAMAGAIAARDAALASWRRMDTPGADREVLRSAAGRELREAFRLATRAANPSMAIKVLLEMRRQGFPLPATDDEVRALAGRMQGEADEAVAPAVVARLLAGATHVARPRPAVDRGEPAPTGDAGPG
ncbi:SIR2 family protein [Micromonospora globbae]|uniref:SIR2 family protein n=1 Tax=Micromonospora globbae TaxID=1894969 RepID=UPI00386F18E1|nr:SIR2 family protein [Micromonospora globbae]